MKSILAPIPLLLLIFFPSSLLASNTMTFDEVQTQIQNVRDAANPTERGFIGNIIANVFNTSGRIQSSFIDAFVGLQNMNIPYWNNGNLVPGAITQTAGTNGRIGIGTNPHSSARVLINGSLRINDGAIAGIPDLNLLSGTGAVNISGSNGISIRTANQARMIINSSGNVGIGTTTPASRLEVNGTVNSSGLNITGANSYIFLDQNGGGGGFITEAGLEGIGLVGNSGRLNNPDLYVTEEGNVGIGTTSPTRKLDVRGSMSIYDSNTWPSYISRNYSNTPNHHPTFMGFRNRGSSVSPQYPQTNDALAHFIGRDGTDGNRLSGYGGAGIGFYAQENFTANNKGTLISFQTTSIGQNNPSEKMRIGANGSVGIGIGNPAERLDVAGNIQARGNFIGAPSCRSVSATGAPPSYIAYASCNSNEYLLNGGGYCETRPPIGILHYSAPNYNGWQADCFNSSGNGENIATAVAVCCRRY